MFWKRSSRAIEGVNWNELTSVDQLEEIKTESNDTPVLIYKHSTRCGISSMVMDRLERSWVDEGNSIKPYYLDLITFRDVSNAVAQVFGVYHESPQVILIKNGQVIYEASHMAISFEGIFNAAS